MRCFVKNEDNYARNLVITINLTLVMLITFIYLTTISVLVMIRLRDKLRIVQNITPQPHDTHHQLQRGIEQRLKQLIFRISLYPLACVLSMLGYFVANIAFLFGIEDNLVIFEIAILSLSALTLNHSMLF